MLPATFCAGMTLPLHHRRAAARGAASARSARCTPRTRSARSSACCSPCTSAMPLLGLKGADLAAPRIAHRARAWCCSRCCARMRRPIVARRPRRCRAGRCRWRCSPCSSTRYKMTSGVSATATHRCRATPLFSSHGRQDRHGQPRGAPRPRGSSRTNGKSDAAHPHRARTVPPHRRDHHGADRGAAARLQPESRSAWRTSASAPASPRSTLLAEPRVERVDTVEIEPAMVEAARGFMPRNSARVRRSAQPHHHRGCEELLRDARTSRYDLIISEPSNPWVSGVSSLFSASSTAASAAT